MFTHKFARCNTHIDRPVTQHERRPHMSPSLQAQKTEDDAQQPDLASRALAVQVYFEANVESQLSNKPWRQCALPRYKREFQNLPPAITQAGLPSDNQLERLIRKWGRRFQQTFSVQDAPRSGRPAKIPRTDIEEQ